MRILANDLSAFLACRDGDPSAVASGALVALFAVCILGGILAATLGFFNNAVVACAVVGGFQATVGGGGLIAMAAVRRDT